MNDVDARGHEWRDGLRYPWPHPPANGQVQTVAEGVLWLRMPLPFGLDHINLYLLRHGEGWVAVDTGLNTPQCREVWAQVFAGAMAGLPLKAVICTHFHSDHTGVVGWLAERFRCPVLMTLGEFDALHHGPPRATTPDWAFLDFYQKAGFSAEQTAALLPLIQSEHFRPQLAAGFVRLQHGSELRIGGRNWQVVMGNGHSPEHACLYNEADGILLAGDQVLPRITSNVMVGPIEPEGNPLKVWIESLQRLRQLPADTLVLPSHQGVFYGLHERLDQVHEHHELQFSLVKQHLAQTGRASAAEMMHVLFPRLRGPVDRLMALGETIAHLNLLMQAGVLLRQRDAGKIEYFSLA